jgi:hypothetical protein
VLQHSLTNVDQAKAHMGYMFVCVCVAEVAMILTIISRATAAMRGELRLENIFNMGNTGAAIRPWRGEPTQADYAGSSVWGMGR